MSGSSFLFWVGRVRPGPSLSDGSMGEGTSGAPMGNGFSTGLAGGGLRQPMPPLILGALGGS